MIDRCPHGRRLDGSGCVDCDHAAAVAQALLIPAGCGMLAAPATPGLRVARWHETFPGEFDPVPGTVVRSGEKFVTVDFDDLGARRVSPTNLTVWSEPREEPSR